MTLEDLERQGYIKKLPIDRKKVRDSLSLSGAGYRYGNITAQSRYGLGILYSLQRYVTDAACFYVFTRLQTRWRNQHVSTVRFAELFLDKDIVIVFDRMRRKRHISVYDTAGSISKTEAKTAIQTAEEILHIIKQRIPEK
jgi:hypothetical protein